MSDENDYSDLSEDPGAPRAGSSNARKAFAVAVAAAMIMAALIIVGLAFAFWSFSRQSGTPVGTSLEPASQAGTIAPAESDVTTSVPGLVTRTLTSAKQVLHASGLKLGAVTRVYVNGFPEGSVVAQSPAAGSTVAQGTTVSVTVSKGSLNAELPPVVGLTVEQAKAALNSAGLSLRPVQYVYDERVKRGVVMSLSFDGAQRPQRGDSVSLIASKGRAPVSMPALVGMSPSQARDACAAIEVKLTLAPAGDRGIVYRQSPAAGSGIVPGTTARAQVDLPPTAAISAQLTKLDATWDRDNDQLGAHITCTSTSGDDRGIASLKWQVKGLDVSATGTGNSISFILPGYRKYGSTSVTLTVVDSSGQTTTVRKSITVNWDTGTLNN